MTALTSGDLKSYALDEVFYTQICDPDSKLSSHFSSLALKFILESLSEKEGKEFLKIFRRDPRKAFSFAYNNIENFDDELSTYLKRNLNETRNYLLLL